MRSSSICENVTSPPKRVRVCDRLAMGENFCGSDYDIRLPVVGRLKCRLLVSASGLFRFLNQEQEDKHKICHVSSRERCCLSLGQYEQRALSRKCGDQSEYP
jgi:hypothetical protein